MGAVEEQWRYGSYLAPEEPKREARIAHEAALLAQGQLLDQLNSRIKAQAPSRINMYFLGVPETAHRRSADVRSILFEVISRMPRTRLGVPSRSAMILTLILNIRWLRATVCAGR